MTLVLVVDKSNKTYLVHLDMKPHVPKDFQEKRPGHRIE
jgi:hypothetical protein